MDRPQAIEATSNQELGQTSIIEYLRRAGAGLDLLSLSATMDGSDEAVRVAEASQCVHRALIALTRP